MLHLLPEMFILLVHSTSVLYSKLSPYFLTALIVASAVSCFVRWNEMCPPACHGKWCMQFSVLSALRILTGSSTCGTVSRECDSDTHLWFSQFKITVEFWRVSGYEKWKQMKLKTQNLFGPDKTVHVSRTDFLCWAVMVQKHMGNAVSEVK